MELVCIKWLYDEYCRKADMTGSRACRLVGLEIAERLRFSYSYHEFLPKTFASALVSFRVSWKF